MIHKQGCLVQALKDGDIDVLVHQVNCQGRMNSGIAKQIREEWPEHYTDYMVMCVSAGKPSNLLGDFVATYAPTTTGDDAFIIGVFGQLYYGYDGKKYTDEAALEQGIRNIVEIDPNVCIGIPYMIGCGLGGGDWTTVKEFLLDIEAEFDIQLYCYKL